MVDVLSVVCDETAEWATRSRDPCLHVTAAWDLTFLPGSATTRPPSGSHLFSVPLTRTITQVHGPNKYKSPRVSRLHPTNLQRGNTSATLIRGTAAIIRITELAGEKENIVTSGARKVFNGDNCLMDEALPMRPRGR